MVIRQLVSGATFTKYDQMIELSPLSANPTQWSSTLKQFVGKQFIDMHNREQLVICKFTQYLFQI